MPTEPPTDRESRVGQPVVRGDPDLAGEHAADAVDFDPDDTASLRTAAETVRTFAGDDGNDTLSVLRGAAACAALVRGEGSYTAAADRADGDATVSFIQKWARVHDLPRAVRMQVATGRIAPSAAKHIARVDGPARLRLAWAVLDHDLTVRDVRDAASAVADGQSVERALASQDVTLGDIALALPVETYQRLHRQAALNGTTPEAVVTEALATWFDG
jgi:hypothetical protein